MNVVTFRYRLSTCQQYSSNVIYQYTQITTDNVDKSITQLIHQCYRFISTSIYRYINTEYTIRHNDSEIFRYTH